MFGFAESSLLRQDFNEVKNALSFSESSSNILKIDFMLSGKMIKIQLSC